MGRTESIVWGRPGIGRAWNDGEAAYPAFVTDPVSMIYGEQEIQRSGKGL